MRLFLLFFIGLLLFSGTVQADCSAPAGVAGDQIFNSTHKTMQFCDGTNWYSMKGGSEGGADYNWSGADYDSGWVSMSSQVGAASFKEFTHGLGAYPSRVKVLVQAIDGNNNGFIFEGMGAAQSNDDAGLDEYGGVIFAYDETRVRLWAPDQNNGEAAGRILNVKDGWGGEVNSQASQTANVRVLVWQ